MGVFSQCWKQQYPYLLTLIRAVPGKTGGVAGYVMVDVNVEKLGALVLGSFPDKENAWLFIVDSSGQMLLSTPYYLLGERDALSEDLQPFAQAEAGYSKMLRMDGEEWNTVWPRRAAPCIIASAIAPPLCAI